MKNIPALLFALILSLPSGVSASGTYGGSPSQPSMDVDAARYEQGKKIYLGKARLPEASAADPGQEARLRDLQSRLPEPVRAKRDLTALAGRLTGPQLEALEYYLRVRYKLGE